MPSSLFPVVFPALFAALAPAGAQVAPAPRAPGHEGVVNAVYVIDGTASRTEHRDVLWRVHARIAAEGGDTSRYWEGVQDIVGARDAGSLHDSVEATVCRDVAPPSAGGIGARNVYLIGFSRGAVIALRVANEVRRSCNAHVVFLGLVDAVNTSMFGWPTSVDSGIPVAVHLVKPRNTGAVFLTTTRIRGVQVMPHPDRGERLTGWGAITHERLVCPVGHERDASGGQATWTESRLVEEMQRAATLAGAELHLSPPLPPSCPPGWRKYVSGDQLLPMSIDATLGAGTVHRGRYRTSMTPSLSVTVAAIAPNGMVAGASVGALVPVTPGTKCDVAGPGTGGCVGLPHVLSLAAIGGRELPFGRARGLPGSLRLTAGPGLYYASEPRTERHLLLGGGEGHLDVTAPARRVAFLVSAQASWIPAMPRDARGTRSLGVGLRIR